MPFNKLAALGAVGAVFGLAAVFAFVVFLTWPHPATGGMELTSAAVCWIAVGLVILALIAVHLVLAKQLWDDPTRGNAGA